MKSHQIEPIYPKEPTPIRTQLKEINGLASSYHNEQYEQLIKKVVPLRAEFRKDKTYLGRVEIAKAELEGWTSYLEARKEQIRAEEPTF